MTGQTITYNSCSQNAVTLEWYKCITTNTANKTLVGTGESVNIKIEEGQDHIIELRAYSKNGKKEDITTYEQSVIDLEISYFYLEDL